MILIGAVYANSAFPFAGFFLGACRTARRPVDGADFFPTFFGEFSAIGGVKRDAHLCSKRRWMRKGIALMAKLLPKLTAPIIGP